MSRAKHWTFTLNNYTDADIVSLRELSGRHRVEYLVFGREVGENGTPHLQGYVIFETPARFTAVKSRISDRAHIEVARRPGGDAANYCKKEGDFEEFGRCPDLVQGKRNDLERFYDWADQFVSDNGRTPSTPEVARSQPVILTRYPNILSIVRLRFDPAPLVEGQPKDWQETLRSELEGDADDRSVIFYVDHDGGKGKSWFVKWFYSMHRTETQVLGVAKRDDLAHMVSPHKRIFLFNVTRGQMEYFQYGVLEMLKDRMVVSPKYHSTVKELEATPHVVVFCNEQPDMTKLSADRYSIRELF